MSALRLATGDLAALARAAEAAYPEEACALLEGRDGQVVCVHPATNVAADRRRRFDVDPRLLLRLHRELRGGPTAIIGVWHSHPDGVAQPSATDLAQANDPTLVWVITPVKDGRAGAPRAFRPGRAAFTEIAMVIDGPRAASAEDGPRAGGADADR